MKQNKLVAILVGVMTVWTIAGPIRGWALSAEELDRKIKNSDTTFFHEFFDNIFYKQFVKFLRFDEMAEEVTKRPALDINPYDEVPDSAFFTNRQGKNPLSESELVKGPEKSPGPDPSGPWRVLKGKMEGVSVGLFIEDSKGDRYLLKFDAKEYPEMTTSAEIISHKFFYAMGYYVPAYYLVHFDPSILTVDPKATYYNQDGFKKPLTAEALQDFIEQIPKMKGGKIRTSASRLLKNVQGNMPFEGRRKDDPNDLIPHEDRRTIRALRVFGSWLNHYDLREGNTLDVIEEENGQAMVKHYLIDFGATLGSASFRPKVPVAGHEHIVDWYEVGKAAPTLKVVEKPWEKQWDALKRQIASPAIGYFDNSLFNPSEWKTQLPYEVFTRLNVSDIFWATKIIMSFTTEDIDAVVKNAEFSDPEDTKTMSGILSARRDIIGAYWFARMTALDKIKLSESGSGSYQVDFEDLNVKYHFRTAEEASYRFKLEVTGAGSKTSHSPYQEVKSPSLSFTVPDADALRVTLWVEARYRAKGGWSHPPLKIVLAKTQKDSSFSVVEIDHGL